MMVMLLSYAFAINEEQLENAKLIEKMTESSHLEKAREYKKTLLLLAMQESDLGMVNQGDKNMGKSITKHSLGMFHMRIITVRELAKVFPELAWLSKRSDLWIANTLLKSKQFQVTLALHNIERVANKSRGSYIRLVSQWNGGFHNIEYYNAVMDNKPQLVVVLKMLRAEKNA